MPKAARKSSNGQVEASRQWLADVAAKHAPHVDTIVQAAADAEEARDELQAQLAEHKARSEKEYASLKANLEAQRDEWKAKAVKYEETFGALRGVLSR